MAKGNPKRKYATFTRRGSPALRGKREPRSGAMKRARDLASLAVAVEIAALLRPPASRKPLPLEARVQLIPRPHRSRRLLPAPELVAGD